MSCRGECVRTGDLLYSGRSTCGRCTPNGGGSSQVPTLLELWEEGGRAGLWGRARARLRGQYAGGLQALLGARRDVDELCCMNVCPGLGLERERNRWGTCRKPGPSTSAAAGDGRAPLGGQDTLSISIDLPPGWDPLREWELPSGTAGAGGGAPSNAAGRSNALSCGRHHHHHHPHPQSPAAAAAAGPQPTCSSLTAPSPRRRAAGPCWRLLLAPGLSPGGPSWPGPAAAATRPLPSPLVGSVVPLRCSLSRIALP